MHHDLYQEVRARHGLPSQMAARVFRQVGTTYKGLWTKWYKNLEARRAGWTRKRGVSLDQPPDSSLAHARVCLRTRLYWSSPQAT